MGALAAKTCAADEKMIISAIGNFFDTVRSLSA
jgi:hypothetical protein